MSIKLNRRRVRKRRRPGENSGMKFTVIIVIMMIAVLLGYITARYVIGPLLGYDADESPIAITGSQDGTGQTAASENAEDQAKAEERESEVSGQPEEGYALQFGVFSSEASAGELADQLKAKGIDTEIVEDDGKYKVISPVLKTKDEALEQLDQIKDKSVEDVFIASF